MKRIEHIMNAGLLTLALLCTPYIPAAAAGYENGKTVEAYTARIKACFDTKDWQSAKMLLDEALALYPDDGRLHLWAGNYFMQQKELDSARYFLIKATQLDSDNMQAKLQLVALEEELGNLSSAVCYVNELLELYPYDRALWKRKIGLYRKKGEHEEADRLLKRLYYIYPNDTTVMRDYVNRMEENYQRERKSGQRDVAIQSLKELLKYRQQEPVYYIDLCNLLMQQGRPDEALAVLSAGIEKMPDNLQLIKKKAEIMTEKGNGMDAYNLARSGRQYNDSLNSVMEQVLYESARRESWKDPYLLYGRIYESQKSKEALDYLLRTSFSRGYDEDALYYLTEAGKRYGHTPDILYRKYRVYKRTGEERAAMRTLEQLVLADPGNEDVLWELIEAKLLLANEQMSRGMHEEALTNLEYISRLECPDDVKQSVTDKLLACYAAMNRNARMIQIIDSIRMAKGDRSLYVVRRASALEKTGRFDEALSELEQQRVTDIDAYEATATRYMQQLMENGATRQAYEVSKRWMQTVPGSNAALRYAAQTAGGLGLYEEEKQYVQTGRKAYPNDVYFVLKEASGLYRDRNYQDGLTLLTQYLDSLPGNQGLKNAYVAHAELRAEQLLKEKKTEEAIQLLKQAERLETGSQSLLYTISTAYEQAGDYEAAYQTFSKYNPSAKQVSEYRRRLMALQRRLYRNKITAELLAGWYRDGTEANSIQSVSYTRLNRKNIFTGTVNFTARNAGDTTDEGNEASRNGVQFKGNWGHTFNRRWSSQLELAVANRFFPTWSGQMGISYYFPKDIELGAALGYRQNYNPENLAIDGTASGEASDMYTLKLTSALYKEMWRVNVNLDSYLLNSNLYFNANSQIRFYPLNDYETHLLAVLGVGTAPEADFLDKMMPGSFDNLNVMFGIGGVYMLSRNLSLGAMASYNRFYLQTASGNVDGQQRVTNYKDLYNIYAQLIFCF